MHMICHVDEEDGVEVITFLYTLCDGPAAASHGFNAARIAGIPESVIKIAQSTAKDLQILHNGITLLSLAKQNASQEIEEFLKQISI